MQASSKSTLLTTDEAASYLRVPARTIERWRSTGVGPRFAKIGRRVAYRVGELEAFIDSRTKQHTAEGRA